MVTVVYSRSVHEGVIDGISVHQTRNKVIRVYVFSIDNTSILSEASSTCDLQHQLRNLGFGII